MALPGRFIEKHQVCAICGTPEPCMDHPDMTTMLKMGSDRICLQTTRADFPSHAMRYVCWMVLLDPQAFKAEVPS